MLPARLKKFANKPIKVLDDGHVQLISVMDDEQGIIDAARVSYGAGTKRAMEDRALLRYLLRHGHTSPFEMIEIKFRVRVPMDCWRQWIRHRTANVNEYSTRYSEAIDSTSTTEPYAWRLQAKDNKQGSAGFMDTWVDGFARPPTEAETGGIDFPFGGWVGQDFYISPGSYLSEREAELHRMAREVYDERLKFGIAREQARKDLPLSTYTEAYWKCDLHNLLHFLKLRLDPHAQLEIRVYAEAMATIVKAWVPTVWEAFEDYSLNAMQFSRMELEGLAWILRDSIAGFDPHCVPSDKAVESMLTGAIKSSGIPKGREQTEFKDKLIKILRK